jgi:hypothetical protein
MRICESFPMMPGTLELAVVNVKAQRHPEATRNINDDQMRIITRRYL